MGLLKPVEPDKRWKRAETRKEMLFQIRTTYALNDWGARERNANELMLGLAPMALTERPDEELRVILDDLEAYKMILISEQGENESED